MKNLQVVVDHGDIHDFMRAVWKTDLFRDSHKSGGFIHRIVDQFAWKPRIFAEMSNDRLERAHFSTWWNVLMLRDDYENPYIHDLYWLHEIYHASRMPYIRNIGEAAFDEKMQRNELEASVLSEIQVYFEMPELRELSFPYPIYADRFLQNRDMQRLWAANPEVAIETIRSMRRDVMVSKPEHTMDLTERWIRRFFEQNAVWRLTWADRYREVENTMEDFQFGVIRADRVREAEAHHAWIVAEAARDPIDNVPFRREAELFAAFYWANKEKYAEAMAAR